MLLQLKATATGFGEIGSFLKGVVAAATDMTPAMEAIGRELLSDSARGFVEGTEPSGRPWQALSAWTVAKKGHSRILIGQGDGELARSFEMRASRTSVVVGTPLDRGGYHQTGYINARTGLPVPARPVATLGPGGIERVQRILFDHLNRGA